MKKVLISLGFAALALGATAQVKIKDGSVTSSTTPNSNAILELESNNKGLVYPRVALTSTSSASPLSAHVQGMTVYNTVTAGSGATAVSPGLYYNNGTQWVRATQPNDWLVFGSTATPSSNGNPAANTDSQYVMGRVAIGQNTSPRLYATTAGGDSAHKFAYLTVNGDASINGIAVGRGGGQRSLNTAVGLRALSANTTGNFNTALGNGTLQSNTTGSYNTALGYSTLQANTTGSYNTALGYSTLQANTTGDYNTALGYSTLQTNTTGSDNIALGFFALYQNTTGSSNTALGNTALMFNTSGNNNTAQGFNALNSNTTGNNNTAQGYQALRYNIGGSNNTALGYRVLYNLSSGNNNIAIGYDIDVPNSAGNYQLNIGNAIWGTGVDSTPANAANIGINTPTPTSSFQVVGSQSGSINVQGGSYGLTATDYTVVFTGGGAVTATLPPATGIAGRMYRIVASGDGTTVTVFSASGTVMLLSTITTLTGQSAIFQSDGTTWYQVQ